MEYKQAFYTAVQFLTVVPTPKGGEASPAVQGDSLLWYPIVGLLIGLLLSACTELISLPFYLEAVVIVILWVGITGGLHLDGLADCADAWLGGLGRREKTLEILKDPLCGSMAVVTLVSLLLLKVAAVAALIQSASVGVLWLVPFVARASLLILFLTTPYVRSGGLGEVLAQYFSREWATRVVIAVVVILFFPLSFSHWIAVLLVSALTIFVIQRAAVRRLGGFTGDVAGAQVEILEATLLLFLAYLAGA